MNSAPTGRVRQYVKFLRFGRGKQKQMEIPGSHSKLGGTNESNVSNDKHSSQKQHKKAEKNLKSIQLTVKSVQKRKLSTNSGQN